MGIGAGEEFLSCWKRELPPRNFFCLKPYAQFSLDGAFRSQHMPMNVL